MEDSRVKDVSLLLSAFFDAEKRRRGEMYSNFFALWPSLVGPRIAAHSRILDVDKGLLIVEAEHPGWVQLLQLRQSSIVEGVSRRFPELGLRGIAFRLSGENYSSPSPTAPAAAEEERSLETEEEQKARVRTLEDIADPKFRAILSDLEKTLRGKR